VLGLLALCQSQVQVAKVIACQRHGETNRTPNVGAKDKKRRKKRSVRNGVFLSTDLGREF